MKNPKSQKKKIGDYVLDELIGAGSFGEVYKSTSIKTFEHFAVKMVNRKTLHPKVLEYLNREIKMIQMVEHENVVKLLDLRASENHYYLVFEYCNGGDLSDYKKKLAGKVPEEMARTWMKQVVKGLSKLYEINGIHRDLKLSNILLHYPTEKSRKENRPVAKLCDFGFARIVGSMEPADTRELPGETSMSMSLVGTPVNMAPEVIHGRPYSVKADMWSLGTVVYELLCGHPPFVGFSRQELLEITQKGCISVPKDRGLSAEAVDFINACLQYEPTKRISWQDVLIHPFISGSSCTKFDYNTFAENNEKDTVGEDKTAYYLSAHNRYNFKPLYVVPIPAAALAHAVTESAIRKLSASAGAIKEKEPVKDPGAANPIDSGKSKVKKDEKCEADHRSDLVFEEVCVDYVKVNESTKAKSTNE